MAKVRGVSLSFHLLMERIETTWYPIIKKEITFQTQFGTNALPLTPEDAYLTAKNISDKLIEEYDPEEESSGYWGHLAKQADEINFATFANDPNGVAQATFTFLHFCISKLPAPAASINWPEVKEASKIPRNIAASLSAMEARLSLLDPRMDSLAEKIDVIDAAHDTAERLPTDMAELERGVAQLRTLLKTAAEDKSDIRRYLTSGSEDFIRIESIKVQAENIIKRCEEAYRITTSTGLAAAFDTRSKSPNRTAWNWVLIPAVSLIADVALGLYRLGSLMGLMTENVPTSIIVINILIAIVGMAGPVWLAWLATRNIGQTFKLSEDYAYKASISKAYEGYRKEAVSLDSEFAKKLFGSALNRLDELPSRFTDGREDSSPLEALLNNPLIINAIKGSPDIKDKIMSLLSEDNNLNAAGAAVALATSAAVSSDGKTEAK